MNQYNGSLTRVDNPPAVDYEVNNVMVRAVFSKRVDDEQVVVGCLTGEDGKPMNAYNGQRTIHRDLLKKKTMLYCPNSTGNNCLFDVIINALPNHDTVRDAVNNKQIDPAQYLRLACHIPHNDALNMDELGLVAEWFQIGFNVHKYNYVNNAYYRIEIVHDRIINSTAQSIIPILVVAQHCYWLKDAALHLLTYKCCRSCNKWYTCDAAGYNKHFEGCIKCPTCGNPKNTGGTKHTCKANPKKDTTYDGKNIVQSRLPDPEPIYLNNIFLADFETFTDAIGTCHVYCASIKQLGVDEVTTFYGVTAITDFAVYIAKVSEID